MKYGTILAGAALTIAAQVSATPSMSVVTVNTEDPVAYLEWARKSGPDIGKAIEATAGGVCISIAGFYSPGEVYYWHTFRDHASAMGASIYNEAVRKETRKLKLERTVSRSDLFSLVMAEELLLDVGDTHSNWNLVISTDDPQLYKNQLNRITDEATKRGFGDVSLSAHAYLAGEDAGDLLVMVRAPSKNRLGNILDQLNSDWMAPIMSGLSDIREYERGFLTNCTVTYVEGHRNSQD